MVAVKQAWKSALASFSTERQLKRQIVTHFHPDHLGLAERFAEVSGAPIVIHGRELAGAEDRVASADRWGTDALDDWGVPPDRRSEFVMDTAVEPLLTASHGDVLLNDGQRLGIPGWNLTVVHTPGHTAGHVVLYEPDRQLLFTGDHVLPNMHPGLGLGARTPANPLTEYLESLARMRELSDDIEVLPGHGYRFRGLQARIGEMIEHRDRRSREVVEVLEKNPAASTWDVASQLTWTAGWENLKAMDLASALSQASMHYRHVKERHL
jgi:glyoxylase-like metal-dependent hydrolase (beta-lactamase superfamily II)